MAYQINDFEEGNIRYRHKVSNSIVDSPVIEIRYKDYAGYEHPVWPHLYWASDIVIEDLENSGVEYDYSVNANTLEPSYSIGNETLDALPPGIYAISGTLHCNEMQDYDDVYFYHRTTTGNASCWTAGSNNDNYRAINPFTNQLQHYGYYTADDSIDDNLEMYVTLGYGLPTNQEDVSVGDDYGSVNFTNVTPVILQRVPISQELKIYDANTGGNEINQIDIEVNSTATVYPKFLKTDSNGTSYGLSSANDYTITKSQGLDATAAKGDGYITIQVTGTNGGYIELNYNDGTDDVKEALYITPHISGSYSLRANGSVINNQSSNPLTLTGPFSFFIWDNNTNSEYTGSNYSFDVVDGDDDAFTVSDKTVIPSRDPSKYNATATISGNVEGVGINNPFVVKVGNISTYYKAGILDSQNNIIGSINTWSSVNNETWSDPSNNMFGIELYEDSSGNTSIPIYCDAVNESPIYGSVTNNQITLTYSGTGNGTVTIPIYTDSSKTTYLGSITVTTS